MPWLRLMAGKIDVLDIILGDGTPISLTHDDIDATGRGREKRKYKFRGKELFYVDYHIYEEGAVAYIISDVPISDNWWSYEFI